MIKQLLNSILLLLILASFGSPTIASAQEEKEEITRILFVFDASNSMNAIWQKRSKLEVAKKLLVETIDELEEFDNVELALRVYGHQTRIEPGKQDCNDTKLEVPFSKINHRKIKERIRTIRAKGTTPIARSLEKSAGDFPACDNCRNIIILITDGIEACDEDPCAMSMALREKGIILKPFVIGIGVDEDWVKDLECIGKFYDASSEESFENVLNIVISQAINNTTVQVNLLNDKNEAKETNVPLIFTNVDNKSIDYIYMHTLNYKGLPDTIVVDPLPTYDLEVHTLPMVLKKNIKIQPGKHNEINVKCPRGSIKINIDERLNAYYELGIIVRQDDKHDILHVQKVNESQKYITGVYDVEILTLPRIKLDNVSLSQDEIFDFNVPAPGSLSILLDISGYGQIFEVKEDKLVWVTNTSVGIKSHNLTMQPGLYKYVFRARNSKESIYTIVKEFRIQSGSSTQIKF